MPVEDLYFRVKVGLRDSDGARVLERRLEDPRAYTYVPDLWDWFVQKHPEGQVVGPDAAFLIARGSGWLGDADKFCAAMVAAEFLAVIPEGFRAKGWAKWAGYHLEVRAKERAKKKGQKDAALGLTQEVPGNSPGKTPTDTANPSSVPGERFDLCESGSVASKGGAGGKRRRGLAGNPNQQPAEARWPQTAAVLAALHDRGVDALWPAKPESADRVEALIVSVGIPTAIERLAVSLPAKSEKWLTFHTDAIRGPKVSARGPQPVSQDFTKTLEDVAREREEALRGQR